MTNAQSLTIRIKCDRLGEKNWHVGDSCCHQHIINSSFQNSPGRSNLQTIDTHEFKSFTKSLTNCVNYWVVNLASFFWFTSAIPFIKPRSTWPSWYGSDMVRVRPCWPDYRLESRNHDKWRYKQKEIAVKSEKGHCIVR